MEKKIKCPRCKGSNVSIWQNGRKRCKDCRYEWSKGKKNTYKGKIACPDCQSFNVCKDGKVRGKQRFKCNDCHAYFQLKTQMKIRPSERKEWLRWIKEEYEKGTDIKEIKKFITDYTGLRSVDYLIRQALGKRKKVITDEVIEKAIQYRKLGMQWKQIEEKIGFSYKNILRKFRELGINPKTLEREKK